MVGVPHCGVDELDGDGVFLRANLPPEDPANYVKKAVHTDRLCLSDITAGEVFLHRYKQNGRNDHSNDHVGDHVHAIIDQ